jgi:NhaA family Na+:H+ antiporter
MPFSFLKRNFISPFLELLYDSRAIGILILLMTGVSLLLANTPFAHNYAAIWHAEIHLSDFLPHTTEHWINDGLMSIFFLLAGLEIKREMLQGELASFKKSVLPVAGALGGMLFPALIFLLLNRNTNMSAGWGIPMATDIAFSLGVASLCGSRAPLSLKIFLTALAIIDDLGAIVAIAFFYTGSLNVFYLISGLVLWLLLLLLNKLKAPFGIFNYFAGILLWILIFNSGVHATVAGVLFAFSIPMKHLNRLEHKLHHPVQFIIIPLFVLANTAITLPADTLTHLGSSLSIGIAAGLLIGKPLGILLFCRLCVGLKWGALPEGIQWKHMTGLGLLAGIGFTMSIFISLLAYEDISLQDQSKTAVMAASFLAILLSIIWFRLMPASTKEKEISETINH